MARILAFLALPFVLLGMLVAPLAGVHFCPQEAIPLLTLAGSLPFIGRPARAVLDWVKSKLPSRTHCCMHPGAERAPTMTKDEVLARIREVGASISTAGPRRNTPFKVAGPGAKPLPDIDLDTKCSFPGCFAPFPGPGHCHELPRWSCVYCGTPTPKGARVCATCYNGDDCTEACGTDYPHKVGDHSK